MRKAGAGYNLPKSVRAICSTTLCPNPTTVPLDLATWHVNCALGTCPSCPRICVDLPSNPNVNVFFLQWKKGQSSKVDINGNVKEVFSLFPVQVGMEEAVKIFEAFFPKIKTHVYVASHQYEALRLRSESLEVC